MNKLGNWLITLKRYKVGCKFVLFTSSKSHTGFRLAPTRAISAVTELLVFELINKTLASIRRAANF